MTAVYYDSINTNSKKIIYAYTDKGICFIGTPNKEFSEIYNFIHADEFIKKENTTIEKQLVNYLSGSLTTFNLNCDLTWSSDFQKSVYKKLIKVDYGQTIDYSDLAQAINKPTASRAVASAVAKNPILFVIPCHRVLRKDGSLGGFRAGMDFKKELLTLESK